MVVTVADTQKEPAKILLPDCRLHCIDIMSARTGQAKPVVGVPLADVLKTISVTQDIAHF